MSVSERTIIVDGLPVVDSDKYDKLLGFIKKKFIAFGGINHIYMPKNESGNTDGFLFITFDEKTSATAALELDHKPMDKKNTFRICMFDDYEKIKDTPAEYSPPDVSHLTKELPNLTTWLFDEQLRDQFVVRYSENQKAMTAIYWDDSHFDTENGGRTLENNGQDLGSAVWTDNAVQWSSQGLYFVTFHDQGAAIWGGEKFERLGRLSHANVNFISFSPCDRYAISHSTNGPKSSYRFWDLSTFSLIRVFDDIDAPTTSVTKYGADGKAVEVTQVPVKMDTDVFAFKWSFDGSYVARQIYGETTVVIQPPKDKKKDGEKQPAKITETRQIVLGLAVYTSPTFAQLDNKMIPANGAVDFIWSPIKNHLAYVTLGNVNLPSTLNVLEIPSRKIIRSKHTFGLVSGKIYWQSSGKHIVFTHSRIINSREKTYGADVIAMTVKNMPQYEVSLPSDPLHVSIDPIHPVFGCVLEGVNARNTAIKTCDVIFYRVNHIHCVEVAKFVPTSGAFAALTKLSFSPAGGVCIISCQASSSIIQFINVKKEIPTIMTNSSGESEHSHPKCNVVAWDPSGRHVALVTSRDKNAELLQRNRDSDSYSIWNFQGDKLVDVVVQNLYYFYWRPRPHTVLSPNKLKEVKANLESVYWKVFEAEEEQIRQAQRDEINQQRLAIKSKWLNSRQEAEAWVRANHPESIYDNSNDFIEIEDYVWEVQSVTKETVY